MNESVLLVRCIDLALQEANRKNAADTLVRASAGNVSATLRARTHLVDSTIEYCSGFFEFELPTKAGADVVVTHEPSLLAVLRSLPDSTWETERTWEKRRIEAGVLLVRVAVDIGHSYFFCFESSEQVVVVIDADSADSPMVAVRSLRSMLLLRIERGGELFLHAAGVARGEKCVLIVGNRFAGKTTTMIDLLLRGFDFVTNDKVSLRVADDQSGITAQGFPVAIGVRVGTLAGLRDPGRLLESACTRFTPADLARVVAAHPDNLHRLNMRIRCYPAKLARVCGSRVAARRRLAGIIVSQYRPGAECHSERIHRSNVAHSLDLVRLDGIEAVSPEHGFFRALGSDALVTPDVRIEDLIEKVPVYTITQNEGSSAKTAALVTQILTQHDAS